MKGSTVFLIILGFGLILVGAGLVSTLPSQSLFMNNYPVQYSPGPWPTWYVGDTFITFVPPDFLAMQIVLNPFPSLNYFGGFIVASGPVDVTVYGMLDFLGTPLVQFNNILFTSYFTDLCSNPYAWLGATLVIENPGSTPVIIVGQSSQYNLSLYSNPMVSLGYVFIALAVFFMFLGIVGEATRPKPLKYIPSTVGETISTGLGIWKKIFPSTVILYGLIIFPYELFTILTSYYTDISLSSPGSAGLTEVLVLQYGGLFLLSVFTVIATAYVIKATSDIIENRESSVTGNLRYVFRRTGKLFIASLITSIIIALGMLLLIIPGIYFAIIYALVIPAIVVTDCGALDSLSISKMLTGNDKLRTFGVLIVAGLIASIAAIPIEIISGYVFPTVPTQFGFFATTVPVTSQLFTFSLPSMIGYVILITFVGSLTSIISSIILATWFYALGGAYEKTREIYVPMKPEEGVIVCPKCKRTIPQKSKFCPYCGEEQK